MLEIFGRTIKFTHRQKNGKNIQLTLNKEIKKDIQNHLIGGLTEGAILNEKQTVVGWWSAKNIYKNPLLK